MILSVENVLWPNNFSPNRFIMDWCFLPALVMTLGVAKWVMFLIWWFCLHLRSGIFFLTALSSVSFLSLFLINKVIWRLHLQAWNPQSPQQRTLGAAQVRESPDSWCNGSWPYRFAAPGPEASPLPKGFRFRFMRSRLWRARSRWYLPSASRDDASWLLHPSSFFPVLV